MRARRLTVEQAFYVLAFLLALGLRILNLGATPLSDYEASWALRALDMARGGNAAVGANPLYVIVTSAIFFVLGHSNLFARLLPALAGSLLVLLPVVFRDLFSITPRLRIAGIILAFGLALDPGLVIVSRLAGGPAPALGFGLLALGMGYRRQPILTGIFAGLALLSGPGLLVGALGLALTWGVVRGLQPGNILQPLAKNPQAEGNATASSAFTSLGLRMAAAIVLLGGTLFLIVPQGLAGLAETLPAYLRGWLNPSGVPALRLPASLLVYQPLIVIFAVVGLLRGWLSRKLAREESGLARRFSLWAVLALLAAMVYPGRQVNDVAWSLVPLWGLASLELAHYVPLQEESRVKLIAVGQALLVFTLLVLAGLNFYGLARFRANEFYYLAVILGSLVMSLIASLLIASGWSFRAAQLGAVWGVCAGLGLALLASTWGLSQLRQNSPEELYSLPPATGQVDLLLSTLNDLSQWGSGLQQEIDLAVTYDSPSLRWALRDFTHASFVPEISPAETPSAIVTPQSENSPRLNQSYRGQDFNWRIYPAWEGVIPDDVIAWLAYRQAPLLQEQIILWGRADLFPGGETDQAEGSAVP